MKSIFLSAVVSISFPLALQCMVIPNDGPLKPERPLSTPGATRAAARFGPFKLPSNLMTGPRGMTGFNMDNVRDLPMPCQGCTYTYIRGDMVYKNGTSANIGNGAYMHHITLVSTPTGELNAGSLLKGLAGLSGLSGGASQPDPTASALKPFYLIGNERLPLTFPKAGVYLSKNASITLSVQLQNLEKEVKEVYIEMDYDYLPGQPEGYTDIIPVPQDALGMGAMLGGIKQTGVWDKTSGPYKTGQDARILMMYGHVHDGGIHTEIMVNGKVVCDSTAYYQDMKIPLDQATTFAETGQHGHVKRDGGGSSHIVAFGECLAVGQVKKGDVITTKVYYNFNQRPSMPMPNGKEDALMGISMTYLGIPMKKE
jgi:hypothetical protein